jgi:DNA polymerase-1
VDICLDGDRHTNLDVYEGGLQLAEWLGMWGARVFWVNLPSGAKTGLDDVLATVEESERPRVLQGLWSGATAKIGGRPRRRPSTAGEDRFFHPEYGLKVAELADAVMEEYPIAITSREEALHAYSDGVYQRTHGRWLVGRMLPQRQRRGHGDSLQDALTDICRRQGKVIPLRQNDPILCVSNGLLDLETLQLHPHSSDWLSTVQLPVPWDPTATCPVYDEWLAGRLDGDADELHEVLGQMFDPTRPPTRSALLDGPTRSGKSTLLRIAQDIAGALNYSSVPLHALAGDDRFAAANLYGSILNTSADLSARDLVELSTFLMATGEDTVHANRKYGSQFKFKPSALLVFSTNTVPMVTGSASAYLERMRSFSFPNSYAGHEDPTIEAHIRTVELPGVLRRWVAGTQAVRARGSVRAPDPLQADRLARMTDRVRSWLDEETVTMPSEVPVTQWTPGPVLHAAFNAWTKANGSRDLGRNAFYQRLRDAGVSDGRSGKVKLLFNRRLGTPSIRDLYDPSTQPWPTRERLDGNGKGSRGGKVETKGHKGHPLVFDLETASSDELWLRPDFIRVVGRLNSDLAGPVTVDTDIASVVAAAAVGATLVAHNGFGFDFVALAAEHPTFDLLELAETDRLRDTAILAMLADPPESRGRSSDSSAWRYELNTLSERLGGPGKTDELGRLKRRFKGYVQIPVDDPDYLAYCAGDVDATVHVLRSLPPLDDYARREMRLLGRLVSAISVTGFRIDEGLLAVRRADQLERMAERSAWLVERHGVPTTRANGSPAIRILQTEEGKAAVVAAFGSLGLEVDDWPRSTKGVGPAIGKEVMIAILEQADDDDAIVELAETVMGLNGEPAAYLSIGKYLVGGRVHPRLEARQATGRVSIVKPGLTILGKRSAALLAQRDVFLADPGCVLFAVDLAQIDARAVAALSGDEAYARIFEPGRDLHAEVAERIWGPEAVAGDRKRARERAKPLSHGYPYGMGVDRLARQAGVSAAEADAYVAFMVESFPRMHAWMVECRALGDAGEMLDNGFGRKMRVSAGRAYTQAPALMGQGCARDLMMEGVLRLPLEVVPMLRAIVHDELVFSVPQARADDVRSSVVDALSFRWAPPDGTGLEVEVVADATGFAGCWGDLYR